MVLLNLYRCMLPGTCLLVVRRPLRYRIFRRVPAGLGRWQEGEPIRVRRGRAAATLAIVVDAVAETVGFPVSS